MVSSSQSIAASASREANVQQGVHSARHTASPPWVASYTTVTIVIVAVISTIVTPTTIITVKPISTQISGLKASR